MPTITITDNTTGSPTGTVGTSNAQIREGNATTNYGSNSGFEVTKFAASDHTHALLKFDLSSVTGPVTVTSVTVGIYLQEDGGGTHTVDLRRLLRDWVEAQATWNIYATASNWTTAGALSDGNDRVATASGQVASVGATLQYYTVVQTSGGLVDDVQGWINGTFSNYGWHLSRNGTGEDGAYKTFTSDDGTNGNRPYLTVVYTEGVGPGAGSDSSAVGATDEVNVLVLVGTVEETS